MAIQSLSVILPCYNEEEALPEVLSQLLHHKVSIMRACGLSKFEILVVDDGSTDQSVDRLQPFLGQIEVLRHPRNMGYGEALKTGFRRANGDLLSFYDLDGTCQPEDLIPLVHLFQKDPNLKMSIGIRLNPNSKMPMIRRIGNLSYQMLVWCFSGRRITDCCSGFRVLEKQSLLKHLDQLPGQLNFTLAMTVLYLRQAYPIQEIQIRYEERKGQSKLNVLKDGLSFLFTIFRYRFFNN